MCQAAERAAKRNAKEAEAPRARVLAAARMNTRPAGWTQQCGLTYREFHAYRVAGLEPPSGRPRRDDAGFVPRYGTRGSGVRASEDSVSMEAALREAEGQSAKHSRDPSLPQGCKRRRNPSSTYCGYEQNQAKRRRYARKPPVRVNTHLSTFSVQSEETPQGTVTAL